MLSQIGCVAVPEHILNKVVKNEPLSNDESQTYESHADLAQSLLSHIPRLEEVAEIIAHQNAYCIPENANAKPTAAQNIPLGSRILKIALDYDAMISSGMDGNLVLAEMNDHKTRYDPQVLAALHEVLHVCTEYVVREVTVNELRDGTILADDLYSIKGTLLCSKGQEVTSSMKARLKNYVFNVGIRGSIRIFLPVEGASDIRESSDIAVNNSTEDAYSSGNETAISLEELSFDELQ
jgi:HD domain